MKRRSLAHILTLTILRCLLIGMCAAPALCALTVTKNEPFNEGYATALTSGSTGQFATVVGTFTTRPGGPVLSGASTPALTTVGWSGDMALSATHQSEYGQFSTASPPTYGFMSALFYVDTFNVNGTATNMSAFLWSVNSHGININFGATSGNFTYQFNQTGTETDTGVAIPIKKFFELRLIWNNTTGSSWNVMVHYRLVGTSTWVTIYGPTTTTYSTGTLILRYGAQAYNGASGFFNGRIGMCSYGSMASGDFSFETGGGFNAVPGVTDPALSAGYIWYLDPINGSDSNDGTKSTSAWLSPVPFNGSGGAYPLFAPAVPWQTAVNGVASGTALLLTNPVKILNAQNQLTGGLANNFLAKTAALAGDTVIILSNSGKPLLLKKQIVLPCDGVTLITDNAGAVNDFTKPPAAPANLTWLFTIPSGGLNWTAVLTDGTNTLTGVYSTTYGNTNYSLLYQGGDGYHAGIQYEDGRPMNHPIAPGGLIGSAASSNQKIPAGFSGAGNTFTGTIGQYLSSYDGSAYVDTAGKIYISAFEAGNPNSDGHAYTSSQNNASGAYAYNSSGIMTTGNYLIWGINVAGTADFGPIGGADNGNGGAINDAGGTGYFGVISNAVITGYGMYAITHSSGSANLNSCRLFDYDIKAYGGSPSTFLGSGGGYSQDAYAIYLHSSGGTANSSDYLALNIDTSLGFLTQVGSVTPSPGASAMLHQAATMSNPAVLNSNFSGNYYAATFLSTLTSSLFANCQFYADMGGSTTSVWDACTSLTYLSGARSGTFNSCIFHYATLAGGRQSFSGSTIVYNYCTFDTTLMNSYPYTPYYDNGNNTVTFNGALWLTLTSAGNTYHFADNVSTGNGDVYTTKDCEIQGTPATVATYLNSTVADVGSAVVSASSVNGLYQRTAASSVVYPSPQTLDFSGALFAKRITPGAYENVNQTSGIGGSSGIMLGGIRGIVP